jgi:hypothetical protein
MDSLNIIHTLWIGDSLSSMENLMLKSFLCNNYNVYLWTYKNILNIPIGISIKDANEIIRKTKYSVTNRKINMDMAREVYPDFPIYLDISYCMKKAVSG